MPAANPISRTAARTQPARARVVGYVSELLLESPYLMSLRSDDIRELCADARLERLAPNQVLSREDAEYLVLDGLLAVKTVDDESGARGIGLFGPGEVVLSHGSSRVKATTEAWLLRLPDAENDAPCIVYEYGDDDEAELV